MCKYITVCGKDNSCYLSNFMFKESTLVHFWDCGTAKKVPYCTIIAWDDNNTFTLDVYEVNLVTTQNMPFSNDA